MRKRRPCREPGEERERRFPNADHCLKALGLIPGAAPADVPISDQTAGPQACESLEAPNDASEIGRKCAAIAVKFRREPDNEGQAKENPVLPRHREGSHKHELELL